MTVPKLTLRHPGGDGIVWTAVPPEGLRIGRREGSGIVLPHHEVSRDHAEVRLEQGRWVLRDLGSANGTWIDGRRIGEHDLHDGDRIEIDGFEIQCWIDDPAAAPRPDAAVAAAGRLDVGDFDALVSQVLGERAAPADDEGTRLIAKPRRPPEGVHDARDILQIVHHAAEALMEHDDLDATLGRVVGLVFEHLPAERCMVLLVDAASGHLRPRVERAAAGAEASGMRISRHIADAALRSRQAVLVRDTSADERFAGAESVLLMRIGSAMCAPMVHRGHVGGLVYVDRRSAGASFGPTDLGVLSVLATISAAAVERAQMRASLEHERRVRERLGRYHAPGVVDRIVQAVERGGGVMHSEEREVSIVFADIAGFTRYAEKRAPAEVTAVLNAILGQLTGAVFDEGGTLDKFIGDAVMAFFGAPLPQPDHARRAVRAALAMQARMEVYNASRPPGERFALHIGVNTGTVIVGDIGAERRMDYTVIGDAVNVASRLESTVAVAGQIVVGEATWAALGDGFIGEALPPLRLKGRSEPFQPYLLRGERGAAETSRTEAPPSA
ncbi:MAG: FHA domain-containing protein [Rubrivivax sp.]|nr:FHA domain-containing protein [Rubrivivax sp.]